MALSPSFPINISIWGHGGALIAITLALGCVAMIPGIFEVKVFP